MSARRRLLLLAIASLFVTAGVAVLTLLFGDFGDTEGRILGTTFAISVASLLALPGAILLERREQRALAGLNVALAVAGFLLALALIWLLDDSEVLLKALGSVGAAAAASTQIAGMTLRRRGDERGALAVVFAAALAAAIALALLVVYAIWATPDGDGYYRILGAVAVIDVALLVVQPLLRRLRGDAGDSRDGEARILVEGADEATIAAAVRVLTDAGARTRVER